MMGRKFNALVVFLETLSAAAGREAHATDPVGLYIGTGIGQASVRSDTDTSGGGRLGGRLQFDEHHSGWKALIGVRPISLLGAEVEYLDFGHPSKSSYTPVLHLLATETDAHAKAISVFALGYLPLPVPLDIYGKAGVARLQTTVNYSENYYCTIDSPCPFVPVQPFRKDRTDTRFAYGAGAQVKFSSLAIRVEYERISASSGDPSLLSLGLTWEFK